MSVTLQAMLREAARRLGRAGIEDGGHEARLLAVTALAHPIESVIATPCWKAASGGHFAAWEQPELYASELRAGFRSLR